VQAYRLLLVSLTMLLPALLSLNAAAQQAVDERFQPSDLLPSGAILSRTTEEYAVEVNPCGRFTSPSQEFQSCLRKAATNADHLLNDAYKRSLEMIIPSRRAALRDTQRAWLQFFSLNCTFAKNIAPVEAQMEQYYDCIIKMTTERAKELSYRIGD
jgi:uncharacterized protein YecT (DUF1311 family)